MYRIVHAFFYLISLLPLRVLYCASDVVSIMLYYVVRYRRGIVRSNLTSAFPEKGTDEIRSIEKGFYRWFCDYFVETVKLLTISDGQLRRRFIIRGADEVERCFAQGRDVGAILGHYCNWEWLSCVGIALPPERRVGLIYHPLRNTVFDRLFRDMRSTQPSGITVPKNDILRTLLTLRRDGVRSIFGYIADQGPKWLNIHLWLPFLHHDTPVFTGAERIMRKMHDAVFYVQMSRPSRGTYVCTFRKLCDDAADTPQYDITRRFFAMLEADIRREPRYYLWSHNRWKRTHEEFDRRFVTVGGHTIERDAAHADGTSIVASSPTLNSDSQ